MIYYDFHIHSALSPCGDKDMTPNNIVNMAAIIGLDAIAISDHNSVGNVRAAMKVGEQVGVKVIAGMEVETAEEIHILTLYETIEAAEEVAKEVYKAFKRVLKNNNLPDMRFHDLRHYQASILHALGVPDKYIMQRGGWTTDSTLKNIYQHTMADKQKEFDDIAIKHFDSIIE